MTRTLVARLLAAGTLMVLAACGSGAAVDSSTIPLVTPAPLAAADGSKIALPPNVADAATPSQRDRYAALSLVDTKLSVHVPAAAAACKILDGGTTPEGVIRSVAAREHLGEADATRVVYAGTLSWCPAHRAPFDDLGAAAHGGPAHQSSRSRSSGSHSTSTSTTTTTRSSSRTTSRSSNDESG